MPEQSFWPRRSEHQDAVNGVYGADGKNGPHIDGAIKFEWDTAGSCFKNSSVAAQLRSKLICGKRFEAGENLGLVVSYCVHPAHSAVSVGRRDNRTAQRFRYRYCPMASRISASTSSV